MEKQSKLFGIRTTAIFEIVIGLAVLIFATYLFDNDERFWSIYPHPCWIIVLLVTVQYGIAEGLLATAACTLFLLVGNMPEEMLGEEIWEYSGRVWHRTVMWIAASVGFGLFVERHIRNRNKYAKELKTAQEREEKISEAYEWVSELKQKQEVRIAGQLRSSIATYKAAKALESLDPRDVVSGVQELIKAVMNPEKFSVYMLNGEELEANIVSGWSHQDEFTRNFSNTTGLFREVIGAREVLCVANDQHERTLDGNGVLAGPLIDRDSGQLVGMLKIENLGFTELNLSTIETFRAICEWVGMAFINAAKYQTAKSESVINPDHSLMTSGYFKRHTDYITSLAKRLNFDVSMIVVKLLDADKHDNATKNRAGKQLADSVDSVLRSVDLAFDYQEDSGEYSVILPATDSKGARVVLDKIEKGLAKSSLGANIRYAFSVHTIHEK